LNPVVGAVKVDVGDVYTPRMNGCCRVTRADATVPIPSSPKLLPHTSPWKAAATGEKEFSLTPSGLKLGMKINSSQAVASIEVPVPTSNGSGDVVDDSFH